MSFNYDYVSNFLGNKGKTLLSLENEGYNVPAFLYYSSDCLLDKQHLYIQHDEYFKEYLKDSKLVVRPSIQNANHVLESTFSTFENLNVEDLPTFISKLYSQFKNKKQNLEYGVIIQKMIHANKEAYLNLVDNKIILSYTKNLNQNKLDSTTHIICNINELNKKLEDEELVSLITKLSSSYSNVSVDLKYDDKWNIINIINV